MQTTSTTVGRSAIGQGLFAARRIHRDERIERITGRIVSADEVWDRGGTFADNCFRFGPESYLDPGDGIGRWLNHSCAPNAAIRKERQRLWLDAVAPIPRGSEITIDYATILGDDDIWTMRCRCGIRGCRGRIRAIRFLPAELLERYLAMAMVPGYIRGTMR